VVEKDLSVDVEVVPEGSQHHWGQSLKGLIVGRKCGVRTGTVQQRVEAGERESVSEGGEVEVSGQCRDGQES